MINSFLDMRAKRGPIGFFIAFIVISVLWVLAVEGIDMALHENHHLSGLIIFMGIIISIFGVSFLLTQAIRRLNDMRWGGMYVMLIAIPGLAITLFAMGQVSTVMWVLAGIGALVLAPLCLVPGKQ
ncbi:hypothetical protein [Cerasicoccus arenae]|uniref:DUF805 domain-containing protein n=1 Tax=Cerasicoccus arenae TaxID=424488 RepID=A0A8J3GDU3_9BACT|nr:hypothetical protein [Cerasicoccus arenae]MBK1859303.1 hypothetical protein [Cerasicoccus arenae]GHB94286.1 hypothetical protein GCM10007047_07460 [Cerasicoccus arenae]